MAFSHHFPARTWSDEETREVICTRDIARCWKKRGMGDFAVALRSSDDGGTTMGRMLEGVDGEICIVEGLEYDRFIAKGKQSLDALQWVGYAGVRDATNTSMPDRDATDPPLPPWQEMVELRYGVGPDFWGKGVARVAAEAVMQWAASEMNVRRFIAETERGNVRSGKVLQKMGFVLSGTDYWKEPSEVEWERLMK